MSKVLSSAIAQESSESERAISQLASKKLYSFVCVVLSEYMSTCCTPRLMLIAIVASGGWKSIGIVNQRLIVYGISK